MIFALAHSLSLSRALQARILYLRGKATASAEGGRVSEEAERMLADAVKLSPSIIDAWNCLGECFWERGEYETAKYTFLGALEHERTAATLCHLSMLLRTMSGAAGLNEALLLESVSLAKESVRLDPTNAGAWSGLGAAHFSCHIHVTASAEDLHLANRAYTQAAKVSSAESADLICNHAMVLGLLDTTEPCLRQFTRAHELDPQLGADGKRAEVWRDVVRVSEAIAAKRLAKTRKFSQMVAELPPAPGQGQGQGGGGGGGGAGGGGPTAFTPLAQLSPGANPGRAIAVKVVVAVPQAGMRLAASHMVLLVADAQEDLMALTVYALRGVATLDAGTTLEITEPHLMKIEATRFWEATAAEGASHASAGFHLLRVEDPAATMRINGHPLRPSRPRAAPQR